MDEINQIVFSDKTTVAQYAGVRGLQPPEVTILRDFDSAIRGRRVLDMGVGAGRTTSALATLAGEYIGVDYAPTMVEHCQKTFTLANGRFHVGDARRMPEYPDGHFHFILFSFNGIDCLDHHGRHAAFTELHRLLKPGGILAFSSHNLGCVPELFSWPPWESDFILYLKKIKRLSIRRMHNPFFSWRRHRQWAFFKDGAIGFKLQSCYIAPAFQIEQLVEHGFVAVRIYSLSTGAVITNEEAHMNHQDVWLYYSCCRES